jgi:TonB family protein
VTFLAVTLAGLAMAATFSPARLATGGAPALPAITVGWGQASVELALAVDGSVLSVKPLGASNPFMDRLVEASRDWTFTPARVDDVPTETHVLAAGIFRPPELMAAAPAESFVAPSSSRDVPRPTKLVPPFYPPTAVGDGVVVVEVHVDATGRSDEISVARSGGAFDSAALDAARQWAFAPATRDGVAVPGYVYVLFGFRQPVVVK